jgi:phosphoserine phosphatase
VDLDGTIVSTDLLLEGCRSLARQRRLQNLPHLLSLRKGRSGFKQTVAEHGRVDIAALPYREPLLAKLREEKARGRRILLVTAAHMIMARRVSDHLRLFDDVMASEGRHNLKAANKARALVERFGEAGFDYIGDSKADLAVWPHCRKALITGPKAEALRQALRTAAGEHLPIELLD